MDVGALEWTGGNKGGGKGKHKGKGKGKHKGKKGEGKSDTEMTCYFCGKVGHRKADCWHHKAAMKKE